MRCKSGKQNFQLARGACLWVLKITMPVTPLLSIANRGHTAPTLAIAWTIGVYSAQRGFSLGRRLVPAPHRSLAQARWSWASWCGSCCRSSDSLLLLSTSESPRRSLWVSTFPLSKCSPQGAGQAGPGLYGDDPKNGNQGRDKAPQGVGHSSAM